MKKLFILLFIILVYIVRSQNCSTSTNYADVGQEINFSSKMCGDSVTWDFGDGTQISRVQHPTYAYSDPGTYIVNVYCSTDTCQITEYIGVSDIKVIDNVVQCNLIGFNFYIFTLIGQKILSGVVSSNIDLFYLKGIYIIMIQKEDKILIKKIFIL